jgi:hypothetical protein
MMMIKQKQGHFRVLTSENTNISHFVQHYQYTVSTGTQILMHNYTTTSQHHLQLLKLRKYYYKVLSSEQETITTSSVLRTGAAIYGYTCHSTSGFSNTENYPHHIHQ